MNRIPRSAWIGVAALAVAGVLTPVPGLRGPIRSAEAAPQPDPIPRRWELDIEPGPLRVTSITDKNGDPVAYYYLTYNVTNISGKDLYLAPIFELATDDGVISRSGRDVPAVVYDTLIRRLSHPLMLDEIDIQGQILSGREFAREGLVVWKADGLAVDEAVVFAAGFSGETTSYTRPDTGEEVVLRKTLMLRHATPGDIEPAQNPILDRTVRQWTMR